MGRFEPALSSACRIMGAAAAACKKRRREVSERIASFLQSIQRRHADANHRSITKDEGIVITIACLVTDFAQVYSRLNCKRGRPANFFGENRRPLTQKETR